MRKLFLAFGLLLSVSYAWAHSDVWRSSNTATADSTKTLCSQRGTVRKGIVHGACVNTGAAGTLTIYNSSSTAVNPVAAIDTAAKGCLHYDVATTSGIVYTNSATANVTIMYDCY